MKRYNPKDIEKKWQQYWDDNQTYKADLGSSKPKYIGMSMLNYPSGAGIHIGHAMNYTISDVMARFKRQSGFESYHPVGWDAFGLPAENYAIKAGVSPQDSMATIIPSYHKQYKAMGWSNDWSKEVSTHDPKYYKWTQWIFSEMHRQGLAYQDARLQWFCTKCQTVLANEQVIDGKCWRHDSADDLEVNKREVKQWFFKITDYADELLEATDDLDWTETVKDAQKNWIGRSVGAEVVFRVDGQNAPITVFTTRPDTLFGATFLVLAPELELVATITTDAERASVEAYAKEAAKKTEVERQATKEKTGVFTGAYAINPINNEKIPIWTADYVLAGYGTGAIMAVPAHDERDNEFARKFDLPIRPVVAARYIDDVTPPKPGEPFTKRRAVQVIVKHPTDNTYLILKKLGWSSETYSYVNGGIEGDESVVAAAMRELVEETGYTNATLVQEQSSPYLVELFHERKGYNLAAHMHTVSLQLSDLSQKPVSEEEKKTNEPNWVTSDELLQKMHGEGAKQVFRDYLAGTSEMVFEGVMIDSGDYSGMPSSEAREKIVADLVKKSAATEKTIYKLRDWSVSRQRYWGAPIPIINCPTCGPVLVPDEQLPVVLPVLEDFQPSGDGRSALARATDWLKADCPQCGGPGERETDTLDTYVCSSWYMIRYLDPFNEEKPFSSEVGNKWLPIDFYNGGDHATAHMIYARFVTRFFHKLGMLDNPEPFKRFLFNGKVMAADGTMFSKSKGNGIDPLEIIEQGYGADALRTYLMFAAPLDLWARWDPQGVPGTHRFINRVWNVVQEFVAESKTDSSENQKLKYLVHPTIVKVSQDLESQKYNTAIATLMKCCNDLYLEKAAAGFTGSADWQWALESVVQLMAPFAPHAAEELWHDLGHEDSVQVDHWPAHDSAYLVADTMTIAVQVNGKLRGTVEVSRQATKDEILTAAKENAQVKTYLEGKPPKKEIYVPGKIVSLVV